MADQAPALNSAHLIAAGTGSVVLLNSLTNVYEWLLNFPWHAPTHEQAGALAVLTLAVLGGGSLTIVVKKNDPTPIAGDRGKPS